MKWDLIFAEPNVKKEKAKLIRRQMEDVREFKEKYENRKQFNMGLMAGIVLSFLTNAIFAFAVEPFEGSVDIGVRSIIVLALSGFFVFLIVKMNQENK